MTKSQVVAAIREKARILYEGRQVRHRSCGIAIAEAFDRPIAPYQALRRGGVTGAGPCGAVVAGQLVLGEFFGYPDPAAPVSVSLREAMTRYHAAVARRLPRGPQGSLVCGDLVGAFPDFETDERKLFCTVITATVAEIVAEIVIDLGGRLSPTPISDG